MRLWDAEGRRLYLTATERARFLAAALHESREDRLFCQVLHYSGCRPSEASELTPQRILMDDAELVFRTLKKRRIDLRGREKKPQFRHVPVPKLLIDALDQAFDLSHRVDLDSRLWPKDRTTQWRMVKRVMARAGIEGLKPLPRGFAKALGSRCFPGLNRYPSTYCGTY